MSLHVIDNRIIVPLIVNKAFKFSVNGGAVQLNPVSAEAPARPAGASASSGPPAEEALPEENLPRHEAAPDIAAEDDTVRPRAKRPPVKPSQE